MVKFNEDEITLMAALFVDALKHCRDYTGESGEVTDQTFDVGGVHTQFTAEEVVNLAEKAEQYLEEG